MAVGTSRVGANFRLLVCATLGGTYLPVSHIDTWNRSGNSAIDSFPWFGGASEQIPGPLEVTASLGGFKSVGDSGQDLIRTQAAANATIFFKVLNDGTNGYTEEYRIGARSEEVTPAGLQRVSWEAGAVGAPAIVGTGPLP